ncbi:MAG: hypothetical protein P9L90_05395 [Candidatus Aadella gelida]|nr:hypothetical protein [Candidatus Aadella gelida]
MYEPIKDATKELYIKIWVHYSVGHLSQQQLAELFDCGENTIRNAVKWCADNRIQFDTPILVEAAKESLETRLRELKTDLVNIKEMHPVNWNAVIGVHKIIKENEELLWKLQSVIQDKNIVNINAIQITQVAKAREEIEENLTNEQRNSLVARIRETVNGW